jgi:hypothetical protein
MWLYDLPERKHRPAWVNLATYQKPEPVELPREVRVARALKTMRARWEEYDAHNGREVDYDGDDGSDSDSEFDEWDDSDDYAEDPDDEWYARKNATI